jgi:hypothetical protein
LEVNNIKKTRISKIMTITLILGLLGAIVPVYATGLLATPPQFQYKLDSSNPTGSGEVTIKNIGEETVNVTIEKKRMLKDDLHLELTDDGIADWITITSPTNFTLAPGQSAQVSFQITAPEKYDYNDAVGAIVANAVPQNTASKPGITVLQGIQLVIPIAVGLPGSIVNSMEITDHSAPQVLLSFIPCVFTYELNNNGTVYANVTGEIKLSGLLNSATVPIETGVYPGDNYTLQTNWTPGFFDFGFYSADTTLNYGRYQPDNTVKTHDTVLVIPVWLIIIIVVGVPILYLRRKGVEFPIKIKIQKK